MTQHFTPQPAPLPQSRSLNIGENDVTAHPLDARVQPLHWANWREQIAQMIPRSVTLDKCVVYDWSPSLDPALSHVDLYLYVRGSKYSGGLDRFEPLVGIQNPDLSFSRRMEDAIATLDSALADRVRDAVSTGHRLVGLGPIVVYKNKQIQHPALFGPTIDTLLMVAAIHGAVSISGADQQIAELGIGNGMISKMMLHKFHPQLRKLWGTDLHGHVLNQGSQNILSLTIDQPAKDKLVTVKDAAFLNDLADGRLQLIVSNPPYIPDLRSDRQTFNGAITGLEVYESVLGAAGHRTLQTGGRALLILSSVSSEIVRSLNTRNGLFDETAVLASKFVPFDLADVSADRKYHDELLDRGLLFNVEGRDYHRVEVVEFTKRSITAATAAVR